MDRPSVNRRQLLTSEEVVAVIIMMAEAKTEPDLIRVTEGQVRSSLHHWTRQGKIKNYGRSSRGQALYDPAEIRAMLRVAIRRSSGILQSGGQPCIDVGDLTE